MEVYVMEFWTDSMTFTLKVINFVNIYYFICRESDYPWLQKCVKCRMYVSIDTSDGNIYNKMLLH